MRSSRHALVATFLAVSSLAACGGDDDDGGDDGDDEVMIDAGSTISDTIDAGTSAWSFAAVYGVLVPLGLILAGGAGFVVLAVVGLERMTQAVQAGPQNSAGEIVWSEKGELGKGAVTCAEGMLYCVDEKEGTVVLAEASPAGWKEHGRFKLTKSSRRSSKGMVWTHPVVSNGKLFLRDQELLSCYDVKAR